MSRCEVFMFRFFISLVRKRSHSNKLASPGQGARYGVTCRSDNRNPTTSDPVASTEPLAPPSKPSLQHKTQSVCDKLTFSAPRGKLRWLWNDMQCNYLVWSRCEIQWIISPRVTSISQLSVTSSAREVIPHFTCTVDQFNLSYSANSLVYYVEHLHGFTM